MKTVFLLCFYLGLPLVMRAGAPATNSGHPAWPYQRVVEQEPPHALVWLERPGNFTCVCEATEWDEDPDMFTEIFESATAYRALCRARAFQSTYTCVVAVGAPENELCCGDR